MSLLVELERRTRRLPPVVRQLGWNGIAAARTLVGLARWASLRRSYGLLPELEVAEFARADDDGVFRGHCTPSDLSSQVNACGMYRFVRPAG
jgi:hypothetical protein